MKLITILIAGLSAVGCTASFNPTSMEERLWGGEKVFTDLDLARIEQLKPQLPAPFRLAIAPPLTNDYRLPQEMEGEREAIQAFAAELRKTGVVSDVIVLPKMLLGSSMSGRHTHDYFKAVRVASARVQADAVLIMSSVTDVSSFVNPLAILDVTLVGMVVVPGHHKEALTIIEGMVMDNRNEYLYWVGSAQGTGSTIGTLAHVNAESAARPSRVAALQAFGAALVRDANVLKGRPPGATYSTPGR